MANNMVNVTMNNDDLTVKCGDSTGGFINGGKLTRG